MVVVWIVAPWMLAVLAVGGAVGLAVYLLKRSSTDSGPRFTSLLDAPAWQELKGLPGRFQDVPQGCLMSVLVATAVWIVVWLIVLIVGLRVLLGG